jgi:tetratricopeptide (TPR) repeat protein
MPDPRLEYGPGDSELAVHVAALRFCTDQLGPSHPRTLMAAKTLATAFWLAGYTDRAIALLDQALDFLAATPAREHGMRADLLSTLGEILFERRHLDQAHAIQREVLEYRIRDGGPNHPASLEAKGDLAAMLYEMGQDEEASRFEQEALEGARAHLGKTHPVTCVLAWNRAMSCERRGDPDSAQGIIGELAWLLVAEPSCLEPHQNAIRNLLERRMRWAEAPTC